MRYSGQASVGSSFAEVAALGPRSSPFPYRLLLNVWKTTFL